MKLPIVFLAVLGLVCGKSVPTGSLKDDLKEFLELVPPDKVVEIALDYLAYDKEVRELVVYVQSEEFPKIHTIVEHLKEYKDCFKFISEYGVDVYAFILEFYDILGLPPVHPTNTTRVGVGIYGFIDDVTAVLPLDDLKALYYRKVETREYFKALVTVIHSPVFVDVVHTVQSWPEYHELLEIVREKVVDVDNIIELFRKLYYRATHSFQDDLKEFTALFPTDEVIQITLDYLAYDPELHRIFAYFQSEEFPKTHKIVEYLKEYKDCLKFINDHGVDVYAFVLEVHHILDFPPFKPTNTTRLGFGIYGFLDDVFAVLPLDDLKALYYLKLETREYFKTFVTTLHSHVFLDLVETVRALPEYQKLLETLRERGIDVVHITKYIRVHFGVTPFRKGD